MRKILLVTSLALCGLLLNAQESIGEIRSRISIMTAGNEAVDYSLHSTDSEELKADVAIPLAISRKVVTNGNKTDITITIKANADVYYNYGQEYILSGLSHNDCEFYMPGFWYHKNLRSPKEAPSFHTSDSWEVRDDRLSVPLTGIYYGKTGEFYAILHRNIGSDECIAQNQSGDVPLPGKTSVGSVGFRNVGGKSAIVCSFPYVEAPKRYIRKLTLIDPIRAFEKINKGETRTFTWEIYSGKSADYSAFIADIWNYSYDTFMPKPVNSGYDANSAKAVMTKYFVNSYVGNNDLKFFSGCGMRCDTSESIELAEIGFVGRTLLNAFNALEYGENNNRPDLVKMANAIFDSYLIYGFTPNGFFREVVNYEKNTEEHKYSIRRQSEGVFAVMNYLKYENEKGRKHAQWEAKMKTILDNFLKLQEADGSFPRKFDDNMVVKDKSGGSTPSATLPLVMAYKYFKNKAYLNSAKRTGVYLEKELVEKADYFSSTLDANCEDKESSLYTSTALYYLSFVTKGAERAHNIELCKKSAYFVLSWYYMWDTPFAPSQMLGDLGFKSRGWGNVSVENNHIDVFIFEFASILDWLSKECSEPRFSQFSSVIKTSMLQLMPVKGRMCGIGKEGYYPEVVQHTTWDYGCSGKGFYNLYFAPGWTVASLWNMLTPNRVPDYFK